MVVQLVRPAPPPDPEREPRRYHDHATRIALTEMVADSFAQCGQITRALVSSVARRADRSERQAERMIVEWLEVQAGTQAPAVERLPLEFLQLVSEKNGMVGPAIEAFYGEADAKRLRPSVYRWMDELDPGLLLALKHGPAALERFLEMGVYEPQHRLELLLVDEMHIPLRCRGPRNQIVEDLYLISYFDTFSRLVVNCQVTVGLSDAAMAAAVLARALVGGTWEGIEYGGSPEALRADNAKIFKADPFKQVLRRADVPPRYAKPFTPADKAMLERWHGTLQQHWLTSFPAYLKGPKRRVFVETGELDRHGKPKRRRDEIPLHVPLDPAQLVHMDEVTQAVYAAIYDYNINHRHSVTGMTPIQAFAADPGPLTRLGPAAFWDLAVPIGKPTYVGERRGVWADNEWRRGQLPLAGREVSVRLLPGLDPLYLIGTPSGHFLEVVKPSADETQGERDARLARNSVRTQRLLDITTVSRANVLARAVSPGTAAYVSETREATLAKADAPRLASVDAALAVPDRVA
jgi:transposase InsO family protein